MRINQVTEKHKNRLLPELASKHVAASTEKQEGNLSVRLSLVRLQTHT